MLRVTLVGVGRLKAGVERALAERYVARADAAGRGVGLSVEMRELPESRARSVDVRKAEEAAAIRTLLAQSAAWIVLDEAGESLGSVAFADRLKATRDAGASVLGVVIGGPDGLDAEMRRGATATIAFGAMTWPHQLVRIMAAEQLYRAVTILAGHPYHRA